MEVDELLPLHLRITHTKKQLSAVCQVHGRVSRGDGRGDEAGAEESTTERTGERTFFARHSSFILMLYVVSTSA